MEKLIKIDSEKLRNAFKRRGLTASEVSQEMGYSRNFLSKHFANGTTTKTVALLLEKMYNLPLDDYKMTEPNPEPEQQEEQLPGQMTFQLPSMSNEDFERIMYTAVSNAIYDTYRRLHVDFILKLRREVELNERTI